MKKEIKEEKKYYRFLNPRNLIRDPSFANRAPDNISFSDSRKNTSSSEDAALTLAFDIRWIIGDSILFNLFEKDHSTLSLFLYSEIFRKTDSVNSGFGKSVADELVQSFQYIPIQIFIQEIQHFSNNIPHENRLGNLVLKTVLVPEKENTQNTSRRYFIDMLIAKTVERISSMLSSNADWKVLLEDENGVMSISLVQELQYPPKPKTRVITL